MMTSMRRKLCACAALVCGVVVSAASGQALKRGEEFPSFSEPDMRTGKTIKLENFRGKVVLVDFWATWCGPCRAELPNVKKNYEKYHKQGFEVISISLDREVEKCKQFVADEKMDWHHIFDKDGKLASKHKVTGIPYPVLIGRDGKILSTEAREGELGRLLEEALKAKVEEEKDDAIETQAKKELAEADKLAKAGKHAEALKAYDDIGKKYAARPTGEKANEKAREIRENPDIMKKISSARSEAVEAEAAKGSEQWLKVAREMAKSKKYDLSRDYYKKVINKYPNTKVAKTAEDEMKKLPA